MSSYKIIDRRGQPNAAYGTGLYATPRNTGTSDYFLPRQYGPILTRDRLLDDYEWEELVNWSWQLCNQLGNLGAAVVQKNCYAVGDAWKPQFEGADKKWGQEAEEWLAQQWYPNCDVRGAVWDFGTNLFVSGLAWDVHGDDAVIFAVSDNGWPLLKHVSAMDIGSHRGKSEIEGGPFDGAKVCNGIILDREKRMIGLRIQTEPGEPGEPNYKDIPSANCQFLFEPEWRAAYRGTPRVAKTLLDWFDVQDIDTFLKRKVKQSASIGLVGHTEDGEPPPGTSDTIVARTSGDTPESVKIEERRGGEIWWMKAPAGERLEALQNKNPTPEEEAFIARLERRGLLAVGWFYELIDPSKIGGASVRLIQDQARASVRARQKTIRRRARRCVQFAVAQAMKTGRISKNPDADWMRWEFEKPAELTVDAGYDEDADRENLKIGTTSVAAIAQKKGRWWEEIRAQREKENMDLIDRAQRLVAHSKSAITLREAIDLMEQRTANGRAPELKTNEREKKE
jgi:hypothetical protein